MDVMNTENSGEKYTPGDGEPIPMSEFTLGERYGSEDMYRDMGIERPKLPEGVEWGDGAHEWTITVGSGPVDV